MLVFAIGNTAAQNPVQLWFSQDGYYGEITNVFCEGNRTFDYRWIFANKTLAKNNELVEADPTRYSVSVGHINQNKYGSWLKIKNALNALECTRNIIPCS